MRGWGGGEEGGGLVYSLYDFGGMVRLRYCQRWGRTEAQDALPPNILGRERRGRGGGGREEEKWGTRPTTSIILEAW